MAGVSIDDARGVPGNPVILALVDYYPPAFRAGGPTRSVPRIVDQLGDEFEFRVLARDHDLGEASRLPGVASDRWLDCGGLFVAVGADTGVLARGTEALAAKFKS